MQRNHLRPACRCEWRVSLRENRLSPNWFRNRLSPNSFEKRLSPNSPRRRAPSPRLRRTAGRSLDFVFSLCFASLCFARQGSSPRAATLFFFPYTLFGCPVSLSPPFLSNYNYCSPLQHSGNDVRHTSPFFPSPLVSVPQHHHRQLRPCEMPV